MNKHLLLLPVGLAVTLGGLALAQSAPEGIDLEAIRERAAEHADDAQALSTNVRQRAEVLTEDGWLKTGDVGEIDGRGRLRITGRIKEIFKTEKGKYVAPAPIENRLASQPGVELACVIGANMAQPIALLNLTPEEQEKLSKGTEKEHFTQSLNALLEKVNSQIDAHERLNALVVCKTPWTVENGLITPTLKLKRNEIEKYYEADLPTWAASRGVIWEQ